MKKIIFVAMVFICAIATSFAQTKVPDAVSSAFNKKFADAKSIKWDKENSHEYEASFTWNGENYSANFSDKGEWLETESPSTFNKLPIKVQASFNSKHKTEAITSCSKIETSKGVTKYEIEIKRNMKTVELFYSSDGVETKE